MAGLLNVPKLVDFRGKVKRHPTKKFPILNLKSKTTIAIHHSLTRIGLGGSNAESYARYHVDTHGWPSIGYSYVIEPDGMIKFCNDIELRTYHVGNHNNYAVGICLTGDFRYEEPTDAQKESLRNLVAALQKEFTHLKYVKGHSEFSGYEKKDCPVFDYKAVLAKKSNTVEQVSKPVNKPSTSTSKPSTSKLAIDGSWGPAVTRDLQRYFKTIVDGVISGQPNNASTRNIPSAQYGSSGSDLIRAMQRFYGTTVDGKISGTSNLITAMQRKYGLKIVDGQVSLPSNLVKEIQRRLNKGKL